MFDWNDQDQVRDTIWSQFNESEDHIVPYPKSSEENTLLNFGDFGKKLKSEEVDSILTSTENSSGAKNDFPGCNLENSSGFNSNEELSAAQLDMDSWPDLPSLSAALGKSYSDTNDEDSIATELLNDFSEEPNLNQLRVQLNVGPEMLANGCDDKENDSFLDCDWANIGDLDDLDTIFSNNDSLFGHEMVGNAGEFLSTSSDVISNTAQTIPMPDMQLSRGQPSHHSCSSFQLDELPTAKIKIEDKTADTSVKSGEQADSKSYVIGENCGVHNQFSENVDNQRQILKSQRKLERVKNNASKNSTGAGFSSITGSKEITSPSIHSLTKTSFQTFQTLASSQQGQISSLDDTGQIGSTKQYFFSGYGYTAYPFAAIHVLHHDHYKSTQEKQAAFGHKVFPETSKHSSSLNEPPEVASRPSMMTPQEKIEKLRRRQQMQAMLAIQQQQQQFGHENDKLVTQASSPNKQNQETMTSVIVEDNSKRHSSSFLNMLSDQDESQKVSTVVDDQSVLEAMYYQLQDALAMLDARIRLCIRDSLFRLAQSAVERQSASDRSSTNKSYRDEDELPTFDETKRPCRNTKLPEAETGTNPIDRTVAHLLFHKPSESFRRHMTEESLTMFNADPASDASLDSRASISEENQNIEEMEVEPPIRK